ncbi:polysaccharide biosynthesis family protein [Ligilactobacillus araffinosus DSM 20653]|uniref:Polysaccharide biosynthesis family protein n=2 Tax=Ligilactobacillus araffinosus TaxID=147809 RepID=A0A0R1ZCD4_9LACO|nr:polysaccharide biosynthesis family protein [Ligilactobacillus araffinosus DSM 20653]
MGVLGIAVMNLSMPLFNVMDGLGFLLGMGGGTLFTIYQIRDRKRSAKTYTQTVIVGLIIGLVFTLLGILCAPQISHLLGADPTTFKMTFQYVQIVLLFGPGFIFNNLLLGFIRNDHGTKTAMFAMTISSLANIFLDWLFILRLNMGMIGAGLATSFSPIISILIIMTHFQKKENHLKLVNHPFILSDLRQTFSIGLPSFLTEMSTGFGIFIYNWVFLKVSGNNAVAAYGIAANVLLVALALFTGVAQGVQPIVSQEYAHRNFKTIKHGLHFGLIIAELLGIICLVFVCFNSRLIIEFFNAASNFKVIALANSGMKMLLISLLFSSLNVIFNIFFSAINNSYISIAMVILRGYILPLILVPLSAKIYGINGVWLSLTVIEGITSIVELITWRAHSKKMISHLNKKTDMQ